MWQAAVALFATCHYGVLPVIFTIKKYLLSICRSELLNHGTADDFILYFFAQLDEIGTVARDAYDEIAVLTIPSYERGVARLLRYDRHP